MGALAFFMALLTSNSHGSENLTIGYLELSSDPRYEEKRSYARIRVRDHQRPFVGAELALQDARVPSELLGVAIQLEKYAGSTADELERAVRSAHLIGINLFLVDLPTAEITALSQRVGDIDVHFFNVSESDNRLRSAGCLGNVFHVIPSDAMRTDALAQHLITKRWSRILILEGPADEDIRLADSFVQSARKYGLKVVARRLFSMGKDPRQRHQNNIPLMTSEGRYDIVFIADVEGEFGRYVPYQTSDPTPVIGTEGLTASGWHWTWERHGAPQLNQRFEDYAGRRMVAADWAAWAALRALVEAMVRTRSRDVATLIDYLGSDELTMDGYKGNPLSFRSWNRQLRQPVFLHTHNAVIDRAPLAGFLHREENLDTLGFERAESACPEK